MERDIEAWRCRSAGPPDGGCQVKPFRFLRLDNLVDHLQIIWFQMAGRRATLVQSFGRPIIAAKHHDNSVMTRRPTK
jgi:hypothetical protein